MDKEELKEMSKLVREVHDISEKYGIDSKEYKEILEKTEPAFKKLEAYNTELLEKMEAEEGYSPMTNDEMLAELKSIRKKTEEE